MLRAQLLQFFKDNGITMVDVANCTDYKVNYVRNVLYGSDKVSRGFCFSVLQAWPETAAFLLPAQAGDNGGEMELCPRCHKPWQETETVLPDGSLGCSCRMEEKQ